MSSNILIARMSDSKKVYDFICNGDIESLKSVPISDLKKTNIDFPLLELSIGRHQVEILDYLLEIGFDDFKHNLFGNILHVFIHNGKSESMSGILSKHQHKFQDILNEKDVQTGKTPLEFAISLELIDFALTLIEMGAQVSDDQITKFVKKLIKDNDLESIKKYAKSALKWNINHDIDIFDDATRSNTSSEMRDYIFRHVLTGLDLQVRFNHGIIKCN